VVGTGEHLTGNGDDLVGGKGTRLFHKVSERPVTLLHDQVVETCRPRPVSANKRSTGSTADQERTEWRHAPKYSNMS
jgi:hypothetical protein